MRKLIALMRAGRRGLCLVLALMPVLVPAKDGLLPGFNRTGAFNEQSCSFTNDHGVRIHINAPVGMSKWGEVKLVLYGLPNGNTIEQTIGKQIKPGDDWHFDIQHIGAQTRFLRRTLKRETIVVAYLENSLKSWPAWRKQHGDQRIPGIINSVLERLPSRRVKLVLTGHSGGGSFTFGYLNILQEVPAAVERIAFLDSNYAYDTSLHKDKLVRWLQSRGKPHLVVLAYRDYVALLNGKTFVSAGGGTWGRSELMMQDLEALFPLKQAITDEWRLASALNGRVRFLLRDNPEKKIWHTVQVERNGFIHAMLIDSKHENEGYEYFGDRAYTEFISAE